MTVSDGNVDPARGLLTPIASVLEFGDGICNPPTSEGWGCYVMNEP